MTVLVLGASVSQLAAIRAGRALGLRVIAVDGDPQAVGFSVADVAENVDFSDTERLIGVARKHRIDGVVAISSDRAVPVAAAVAEALGLPGVGVETARARAAMAASRRDGIGLNDRSHLKARLERSGIRARSRFHRLTPETRGEKVPAIDETAMSCASSTTWRPGRVGSIRESGLVTNRISSARRTANWLRRLALDVALNEARHAPHSPGERRFGGAGSGLAKRTGSRIYPG